MNLFNIFTEIENIDADAVERINYYSRRQMFRLGAKAAAAAVPATFAAIGSAYGQGAVPTVTEVLNFALTLEYLEAEFYRMGLMAPNLIPAQDRAVFMQISKHEDAHVKLLQVALGAAAVMKPNFKFPGDAFTNYQTFMFLAKALEDTGVRAYKGQAQFLTVNKDVLTVALRIHSVEARHAAEVRRLMGIKEWPSDPNEQPTAVYAGEVNTIHGGVNVAQLVANMMPVERVREAFDEPLTKEAVLAIAGPFIG
ncbi:hypothetical protein GCM10023189_06320 [Nibrella saemangeumensis]|uniref:Ferritin-like domain-containing protein n=1 Tax=Nibrella saemangeumensis TaxID=1084526 RepID=A0ABP8MF63_9BACT